MAPQGLPVGNASSSELCGTEIPKSTQSASRVTVWLKNVEICLPGWLQDQILSCLQLEALELHLAAGGGRFKGP